LNAEIVGCVKAKCFLSGIPEVKLGFNDKVHRMEDVHFHQCVRATRFEEEQFVSIIPPDGEVDLMSYRYCYDSRPLIWVDLSTHRHKGSRVVYQVKAKSNYKNRWAANEVEIEIHVPPDADSPQFEAEMGKVVYVPDKDIFIWKIKRFPGQQEYFMRAQFGMPSIPAEEPLNKVPIKIRFEIPSLTASGLHVRFCRIVERIGYAALPWVRYLTSQGDYQIRTAADSC